MIEDNVINYIDLGESMQNLDVYSKKGLIFFFKIFEIMLSYKVNNQIIFILLKIIFFLQVITISSISVPAEYKKNDYIIKIINSIQGILIPHKYIVDKNSYIMWFIIATIFCLIILLCIIYLIALSCVKKISFVFPIKLLNILNLVLNNYGLCPLINIMMMAIHCDKGIHKYLEIKCYTGKHLIYLIISLFLLICLLFYSFLISIYYYEIGTIQETNFLCRSNSYFETLENILSEICFFLGYLLIHHLDNSKMYRYIYLGMLFINSLIIAIYFNHNVFYYNHNLNIITINGWYFIIWYLFIIMLKEVCNVNNILLTVIIGWILITVINYSYYHLKIIRSLTESNVFDSTNLKNIEMFNFYLIQKGNENLIETKVLLRGIINSFEEYLSTSVELKEKYEMFLNNLQLQKKFGGKETILFSVYNITFLIYEFFFDKPSIKNDMLLIICYFLVNRLDNYTYASLLCSQIKVSNHKAMYLKYLLMEKIKKYQMNKLSQTGTKESIKHVEIGSVIVYNYYIDNFKLKIYDGACSQIEYFDILKNTQINKTLAATFMKMGEKIIKLRNEIIELWEKIIKLNPFNEENERDYLLYIETIIQDLDLAQKEQEKYVQYRNSILSKKNNLYYSLFNKDISSIILVDGYALRGKILYTTPDFSLLYNYLPKELLNLYIYDLMPPVIAEFHKELENDAIKYSNLTNIFTKKKKLILKGKNNNIYNISLFAKCLPNLSYGLIYIINIDKLIEKCFLIILDKNFIINCLSDAYSLNNGTDLTINATKVFDLKNTIIGHHIGVIMPEFLIQIEYKNNQFIIKKQNIELKAILFPNITDLNDYDLSFDKIMDKIKTSGKLINEEEAKQVNNHNLHESTTKASMRHRKSQIGANNQEFKEIIFNLSKKYAGKSYNVFYKIFERSFLDDKYHYYKIEIDNDFIGNTGKTIKGKNVNLYETKISDYNSVQYNLKNKVKAIKFQVVDEPVKNENEDKKKEVIQNNDNANFEPSHNSFMSSSSSIDNSSFTKLKFGIMDNEQPLYIIYMKIILFVFSIASIVLIICDCITTNNEFSGVDTFLNENLFFNFSKISSDCFYIATTNLKFKQYNINNLCNGRECDYLYNDFIILCINQVKEILESSANYNEEYKQILTKRYPVFMYAYNTETIVETTLDTINTLRLFLTQSLYIYHHFQDFLNGDNETNALLENVVGGTYYYYKTLSYIKGFDENERRTRAIEKYKTKKIFLIINVIICACSVVGLAILISRFFKEEKYFIQKLVKFQSPKFDAYLKYLENLKKKLRNDNGDDDDQQNQDENHNNSNESEENKHFGRKGSVGSNEQKKKKNDNRKRNRKKMQGKISKLQQQKNDKINIMTLYFFKNNVILGIELGFILVAYMTYYILINLIYIYKRNKFFDFDDIINNLEGIYKTCFDIYVDIKYEEVAYVKFMDEQKKAISKLEKGASYVEFEGVNYTDINELSNQYYTINVPNVTFNKIGNLLLSIIPIDDNDFENTSKTSYTAQLKHLYSGNVCNLLYEETDETRTHCFNFWSSILTQGMEQGFNQLSVELNAVQNELILCNKYHKNIIDIILDERVVLLEYFYNYYFMDAYLRTKFLLEEIRSERVNSIYYIFELTMIIYICISASLCIVLVIFVETKRKVFCSFLNFIGIIPFQYLSDDDDFYRDILRLEKEVF